MGVSASGVAAGTVIEHRSAGGLIGGLRRSGVVFVLVAAVIVLALPTLGYPLGRDQGEFATLGRGLLTGDVPYVDLWNPKPPAVFYVYAAAIRLFDPGLTGSTVAIRLIDLLIVPAMLLGLHAIAIQCYGERRGTRVGWVTMTLFGAAYFTETFWTLTQNDGIVLLPMIAAVYAANEAARGGGYGRRYTLLYGLLAGGLAGVVFWFKYPFALFIVALIGMYIMQRRATALHSDARVVATFVAGLVLTGGGFALYLAGIGAWPDLIESVRVTVGYAGLGAGSVGEWLPTALGFRWQHWGSLFVLALIGLAAILRQRHNRAHGLALIVWLIAGLGIMGVQAKGYDYHWLPLLPALSLIAAVGVIAVIERLTGLTPDAPRRTGRVPILAVCAAVLVIAGLVVWPPALTGRSAFVAGEFVADESTQVAAYLRERTTPGDSLFIWGFRPEVYYLSRLQPATRYIFQFPLVGSWYPQEWQDDNVSLLWAALPPYVLILQGDYMPWVTGSAQDSATLLQAYTELNNWLMYNYERDAQIGTFQLWRRRST